MIVSWTLLAFFTALAVICWHYANEALQWGEINAIQSFEGGFWFGLIGASLMLVWITIWYFGHALRTRRGKSE